MRKGEREAQRIEAAPFNPDALEALVPEFRSMSRTEPHEWLPQLQSSLASCGVVLLIVPHLPNMGAFGATRWIASKAVIQLCVYRKWEDEFWFTFFHELAHVLRQPRTEVIEFKSDARDSPEERLADRWAQDWLIQPEEYAKWSAAFGTTSYPSARAVQLFAARHAIAPAIEKQEHITLENISHEFVLHDR